MKKKRFNKSRQDEKTKDKAKALVRRVFKNARQKLVFDNKSSKEKEVKAALGELGIAFYVGDMPYETSDGGITYKHTLFVRGTEALQAILNETD